MKNNKFLRLMSAMLAGALVISCTCFPAYAKGTQVDSRGNARNNTGATATEEQSSDFDTQTPDKESEPAQDEDAAGKNNEEYLTISEEAEADDAADAAGDSSETEAIDSGSCGDSLTWVLDGDYTLTISGSGAMGSWDWYGGIPWYSYVDSITAVVITDGVTSVGDYAFYGCEAMTSAILPESVTTIGMDAFYGCKALTALTLPDGLTTIGEQAFYNCSSLSSINIPDTVTEIDAEAFYSCSGLKSIKIPDSVTVLSEGIFYACTGLTEINIPETVTSIGDYAFGFCIGLTGITIPASVTEIGSEAFYRCSSLASVTVDSDNAVYSSADGALYSKDGTALLYCPGSTTGTYTVSEGVTAIGTSAFSYCTGLAAIGLPESLTSVGDCAFYYCTGLTAVVIPDGVLTIGESAFDTCTKLTEVTLGDSVTTIGEKAFYNCAKLTDVTFGSSVTTIESYAFAGDTALAEIVLPESLVSIGNGAFRGCAVMELAIPDSVVSIGTEAFLKCTSLESVTIGSGVASIGAYAFEYCTSLTAVTIPNMVQSLGKYAFYGCTGLENAILGSGLTSVGSFVFAYCTALSSVTVPDSITSIGTYAFAYCEVLSNVYFEGSECQWEAVSISSGNTCLTAAELHCTTGHCWDAGTVTQEASKTEEGVMTYTCTVCGATKTEAIAVKQITAPSVTLNVEQGIDGKIRLIGTISDYENSDDYYEVTGHGFVYITKAKLGAKALTVNTSSRTKVSVSGFSSGGTYIYSMMPKTADTVYVVRAYVTYKNASGKTVYVYSDQVVVSYSSLAE